MQSGRVRGMPYGTGAHASSVHVPPTRCIPAVYCRCTTGCQCGQVEDGEWDVLEALGDERFRKQGAGGKGRLDRGEMADTRLDMPLPWDHVDTGGWAGGG